jgi:hypothetical protein
MVFPLSSLSSTFEIIGTLSVIASIFQNKAKNIFYAIFLSFFSSNLRFTKANFTFPTSKVQDVFIFLFHNGYNMQSFFL